MSIFDNIPDKEKICGNCPHCKVKSKEGIILDVTNPNSGHIFPAGTTLWCILGDTGVKHQLNPAIKGRITPVHSLQGCRGVTKFWNHIDEKEFEFKTENNDMAKDDKEKKHKIKVEDCDFFMITVDGTQGSKQRHADYDTAVAEAKRIANKRQDGKEVFILGVVSSIKPEVTVEMKENRR